MGRLNQGKGILELIPAFARYRNLVGDAHLVIAGAEDGLAKERLDQLARDHLLTDRVSVVGFVDGRKKSELLADADVFVLPSKSEGLSMAMLEAMAAGIPVLTTDRVGLWRTLKDENCGVVVPVGIDALVEGLKELSDRERRRAFGRRARDLVARRYTWDAIAASFLDMVENQSVKTSREFSN
jgi:glycosyltransferase involved in cell wall biosynthesis